MLLKLFPTLSTRSKRAMLRTKTHFGKSYSYVPRGTFLEGLAKKFSITKEAAFNLLMTEREYLINLEKRS